jgi:CARDB protein
MSLRWLVGSLLFVATGCASSSVDLVPVPGSSASTAGSVQYTKPEVPKLQVQVMNQGKSLATSSPVVVEFFLRNSTVTSPPQDGGQLAAGETSKTLEFEIPQGCMEGGCSFRIQVDPGRQLKDANRSNNVALGECVGQPVKPVEGLSRAN